MHTNDVKAAATFCCEKQRNQLSMLGLGSQAWMKFYSGKLVP